MERPGLAGRAPGGDGAHAAAYTSRSTRARRRCAAPRRLPPTRRAEKADQYAEDRQLLTWNGQINSADVAYILYQAPVLVAIHAREMLGDA